MNALLSKVLPTDLIPSIMEYILRPDWKTCRLNESNLVREAITNAFRNEHFRNENFDGMIDAYTIHTIREFDWTLYGTRYILSWVGDGGMEHYGRPPRIYPLEEYYRNGDNYNQWYTQYFMYVYL